MTAGVFEGVDDDSGVEYLVSDILGTLFELCLCQGGRINRRLGSGFRGWSLAADSLQFTTVIATYSIRMELISFQPPNRGESNGTNSVTNMLLLDV